MRDRTTAAEWFALALFGAAVLAFLIGIVVLTARLAGDPHPWSFGHHTASE